MSTVLVVGVDPGQTSGIVAVDYDAGVAVRVTAVQAYGPGSVPTLVRALLRRADSSRVLVATEGFVVSGRAARSATAAAGAATRELIGQLRAVAGDTAAATFVSWPAGIVKTWATDRRLDAAGLTDPTRGMHHARDAARHAIYAAVHEHVTPDPLSARAVTR